MVRDLYAGAQMARAFALMSCTGVLLPNATALALEGQAAVAGAASAVFGLLQFAFAAALASLGGVTALVMAATICATAVATAVIRFGFGPRAGRASAAGA
jgi:DHA1 family bicyclomycin/chloramphenicol resistance-like MFS transporter